MLDASLLIATKALNTKTIGLFNVKSTAQHPLQAKAELQQPILHRHGLFKRIAAYAAPVWRRQTVFVKHRQRPRGLHCGLGLFTVNARLRGQRGSFQVNKGDG